MIVRPVKRRWSSSLGLASATGNSSSHWLSATPLLVEPCVEQAARAAYNANTGRVGRTGSLLLVQGAKDKALPFLVDTGPNPLWEF
jgi:hypothetical protein